MVVCIRALRPFTTSSVFASWRVLTMSSTSDSSSPMPCSGERHTRKLQLLFSSVFTVCTNNLSHLKFCESARGLPLFGSPIGPLPPIHCAWRILIYIASRRLATRLTSPVSLVADRADGQRRFVAYAVDAHQPVARGEFFVKLGRRRDRDGHVAARAIISARMLGVRAQRVEAVVAQLRTQRELN
jgi:hypothetical protein